jgi:hypothetical protein
MSARRLSFATELVGDSDYPTLSRLPVQVIGATRCQRRKSNSPRFRPPPVWIGFRSHPFPDGVSRALEYPVPPLGLIIGKHRQETKDSLKVLPGVF